MPLNVLSRARARSALSGLMVMAAALLAVGRASSAGQSPQWVKPSPSPVQRGVLLNAQVAQAGSLINVEQARLAYGVNGSGMTAAVLDTGIRATHNDFAGRLVAQVNYTAENGGSAGNAADGDGHGTHVSGIIASNGTHVGMAPGASIAAVKVLDNDGSGAFSDIQDGLDWVIANRVAHNITVVNMSLGDGRNYTNYATDGVLTRIATLRAARVAVCAAAGNEFYGWNSAQGMGYPAIFASTISVGAVYDADIGGVGYGGGAVANTTAADRICPFSQRLHPNVSATARTDIFAPGAAITSAGITSDNSSATSHGTSQAAPVVAGVVLLLQDYYQRTTGSLPSVDQLETWLRAGAETINDGDDENDNVNNTGLSFPRVDALAALQAAETEIGATFSISGQVTDNGAGLQNVTVSTGARSAATGADGRYSITGLTAGAYTVTPSRTGFTFTPESRSVTVGPNRTGVDFATTTVAPTTFSISGTVRGANGAGLGSVSVQVGGVSTTTSAAGAYSVSGLVAGSYTVTASRSGYTMSPASRSVTVGPSQSSVDFTATPIQAPTYSISGSVLVGGVGLAGVQINTAGGSVVTSAAGAYSISGLSAGSYTVTASRSGYTLSPASRAVAVGPSATSVNFTATLNTYAISGTVRLNGVGLGGVSVTDGTRSATTGASGQYTLSGVPSGAYTVTPTVAGYTFAPVSRSVTVGASNQMGIDFAAASSTFRIAGRITANGASLGSVSVTVGGTTVTTDGSGNYEVAGLAAGTYAVQPSRSGYQFSPSSRTLTVGPDRTDAHFTAVSLHEIRGRVTLKGVGLSGVTLTAGPRTTATDANGDYTFADVGNGSYTVTASGLGYTFEPPSRAVAVNGGNVTGADFAVVTAPYLTSVVAAKGQVVGGKSTSVLVNFDRALTATGTVTLTVSDSHGKAPRQLKVKRGKTTGKFTLKSKRVTQPVPVTITATHAGVSRQTVVTLIPR
ncbi:MAG: carboxypeptidase regulatory-like domain-containing protein [Actinomycetota bacterium]